jgi:hypothetical protein
MAERKRPTDEERNVCLNEIAAALTKAYGYVPLMTRYRAGDIAMTHVEEKR